MITDLTTLGLSKEQVEARVHGIGGSDANIILGGAEDRILKLWEQKTGRAEPEDLSGELYVVMGQFTEPLNAAWFTKQTGIAITRRSVPMTCLVDDWRTANIDGLIGEHAIWEAKHTNPFQKQAEVLAQYMPQLHHNMDVAHVGTAHLSAFMGNLTWVTWEVRYDAEYAAQVHKAEWEFWMSVLADEPPVPYPVPKMPAALAIREVDMTGDNAWADHAQTWLDTRQAASRNDDAKDGLKKMVEADVARAYGHGVEFRRDKRGSLRLYALEG